MLVITADALELGGFGGVRERLFVMDEREFGSYRNVDAAQGLGQLRYLADGFFKPGGRTGRHQHRQVDIITLIVAGSTTHEGSLGDGLTLNAGDVLIQQAGERGFEHDEINTGGELNHFVQVWMQPLVNSPEPSYQLLYLIPGQPLCVYGAEVEPALDATQMQVFAMQPGQRISLAGEAIVFLATGELAVREGTQTQTLSHQALVRGQNLEIAAGKEALVLWFQFAQKG